MQTPSTKFKQGTLMSIWHVLKITIASFSILIILPAVVYSQPWAGVSFYLGSGNYISKGGFTKQSNFFGYPTPQKPVQYQTIGDGTGMQLGYQYIFGLNYSVYAFLDELSGEPSSVAIDNFDRKLTKFPNIKYSQRGYGVENRLWLESLYAGLGLVSISERHTQTSRTNGVSTTESIKTNSKVGLIYSFGAEIANLGLLLRVSNRSASGLKTENREIDETSSLRVSVGYRWGRL